MKAIWNGKVIAESDQVLDLDGNLFFPISSIKSTFFLESNTQSVCPWKGKCRYLHIVVQGEQNHDAAWYFHEEDDNLDMLKNRISFWKGVSIEESSPIFNAWCSVKSNISHSASWIKKLNLGT